MKYLHTMIRVSDLDKSLDFFVNKLGFVEQRRHVNDKGRYTLVFVAALVVLYVALAFNLISFGTQY